VPGGTPHECKSGGREPLVRVGEVSVAAGVAGLTVIGLYAWMMQSGGSADAAVRGEPSGLSVFGTIHPPLLSYGKPALETEIPKAPRVRLASLEPTFDSRFAPAAGNSDAPATTGAIDSFVDRFGGPSSRSIPVRTVAVAAPPTTASIGAPTAPAAKVAPPPRARLAAVPLPRPAPRSVVAQGAPERPAAPYRLASLSETPVPAAAQPADSAAATDGPQEANPLTDDPTHTAIYDISRRSVYLPSGERLEAHSGLGGYMDDARAVSLRKQGPTPPNVYDLKMRESLFHGIHAIRLVPVNGSKMFGRDGMLVHPFMLGPEGASNGCVSVRDYPAFLKAYQSGQITRLVVVERLDDPPSGRTPAEWIASTMKRLFGPS